MLIKFSPVKVWWFVLPCALFVACGDDGLHDYVNDHVIGAQFSSVQNADGSPVERLPSGEIVWADVATPPVLRVILDNPRRTVYGVTYSGNGSASVKRAAQDTADLSSIYIELAPADDVAMRVVDGNLYGDISINVRLIPPSGKIPPDDIFLSILRKYPEKDNTGITITAVVSNEKGETRTLKDKNDPPEQTAPAPLKISPGETLTFTASGHDLENASVWVLIDGLVVEQREAETAPAPYVLPVTFPYMAGKDSSEVSLIILDNAFSYVGSFTNEVDVEAVLKIGNTGTGYATLAEAVAGSPEGGTVILVKSVEINAPIAIKTNVLLVADPAQTLAVTGPASLAGSLFTVERGATFTLCGNGSGAITLQNSGGSAVTVEGAFIMDGGVISDSKGTEIDGESDGDGSGSGNKATGGGGVYVAENATFTMNDGSISNNTATGGGGVYVAENATFTMNDGSISGNTATGGGGVYVAKNATFTMNDGAISGNRVDIGGGVYVAQDAAFTMNDGSISDNTASDNSGGVGVEGGFTMTGGAISRNAAVSDGGGVGVYSSGSFTLSGGEISDNTAQRNGGGVYVNGTFTMAASAVVEQDVYLANGKTIGVSGKLSPPGGTSAIITMADDAAVGTTVLTNTEKYTFTTDDISKFKLTTNSPVVISLSNNKGVIASANMSVTVNGKPVYYISLADAIAASTGTEESPAVISLMNDIDVSASIAVGGGKHIKIMPADDTVTISRYSGSFIFRESLFYVGDNASLTLAGSGSAQLVLDGGSDSQLPAQYALVTVYNTGTLTMKNGSVLQNNNNTTSNGGGVYIEAYGDFTMTGGEISGNTAAYGGGGVVVYSGGSFTMEGGSISGNTSYSEGGGVYVYGNDPYTIMEGGTFTMSGGTISGNTADTDGGGVCVAGPDAMFFMNGGTIYGASEGTNSNMAASSSGSAALYTHPSAISNKSTTDNTIP